MHSGNALWAHTGATHSWHAVRARIRGTHSDTTLGHALGAHTQYTLGAQTPGALAGDEEAHQNSELIGSVCDRFCWMRKSSLAGS